MNYCGYNEHPCLMKWLKLNCDFNFDVAVWIGLYQMTASSIYAIVSILSDAERHLHGACAKGLKKIPDINLYVRL